VNVKVNQVGPGIVWLEFSTLAGKLLICESVTPIAPMLQRTLHIIYAEKKMPRFVAKFVLKAVVAQYERDVPVWQWKNFPDKPVLVKEDRAIRKFRKWFAQFYSLNSVSFKDAVQNYQTGRAPFPSW